MDDICAWFQTVKLLPPSRLGCPLPNHPSIRLINELQSGASQEFSCFCRRLFHIYNGCIIAHDQMGNPGHTITDSELNGRFLQFISLRRLHLNQTVLSFTQVLCIMPLPAANPFLRCLPSGFCPAFDSQQRAFQHFLRIPGQLIRDYPVRVIGGVIFPDNEVCQFIPVMKLELIWFKCQHVSWGCLCLTAHIGIRFKIPIPVHVSNGLRFKLRLSQLVRGHGTAYGAGCLVHKAKLSSL